MAGSAGEIFGHLWRVRSALLAAALTSACATQAGTSAEADGSADVSADTGADLAACNVAPHLKSIQANYFTDSCALSHCHDSAQPTQGNLDLSNGKAFAALVNAPAFQAKAKKAGKLLVVPGHPEQSYLYEKLTLTTDGVLMPYGATEPYDVECSLAAVKKWIEDGAKDD